MKDVIGREWQLGTVQVDYNLPERFDLWYIGADGGRHRPVMIHRAPFGSMERFVGVLIEHFGGRFPTWLSPTHLHVLTISERHADEARRVVNRLRSEGSALNWMTAMRPSGRRSECIVDSDQHTWRSSGMRRSNMEPSRCVIEQGNKSQ